MYIVVIFIDIEKGALRIVTVASVGGLPWSSLSPYLVMDKFMNYFYDVVP